MRAYQKRAFAPSVKKSALVTPGFTLAEIIDQFFAEGVVPDFIPADLGEDMADEVDADGSWLVDPYGDIRTDPMEMRENALMSGIKDPDPVPDPTPPAPPTPPVEPTE